MRSYLSSWLPAVVIAGSTSAAPRPQVDLSALFTPPSAAELDQVRAEWAGRNPLALKWRIEGTTQLSSGHRLDVVSHLIDGRRHYGAVRYPLALQPGSSHPVMVYLHGGFSGVHVAMLRSFDSLIGSSPLKGEYFYLLPSFRGESLGTGTLGSFHSKGSGSAMDRDVDDSMALLDGLLAHVPEADRLRVCVFGTSRGGGTALLMGIRDGRVRKLVDAFGMTDFFQPSIQAALEAWINSGVKPKNPAYRHALGVAVDPYLSGQLSLTDARLALVRSSAARFASDLPHTQIHHGRMDQTVDIEHSDRLDAALKRASPPVPYEYFRYVAGVHNLSSLNGAGARIGAFFGELALAPSSYCVTSPNSVGAGALIDTSGSTSLSAADLILSASGLPPAGPARFIHSATRAQIPFGQGVLCLGSTVAQGPTLAISPLGTVSYSFDFNALGFTPGTTRHFQLWYRDGGPINYTDALTVTFGP